MCQDRGFEGQEHERPIGFGACGNAGAKAEGF